MTAQEKAERGLDLLRYALALFTEAGSVKTAARVRLAISSAKGAVRHAAAAPYREARQRRKSDPTCCPVNDPDCVSADGECHDACEPPEVTP